MKKIQLIYTMDTGQHLANFPVYPHVLESKRNLITFAKQAYYSHVCFMSKDKWGIQPDGRNLGLPEEMPVLPVFVKISCCIITEKGSKFKTPIWYDKCEGKLWWKDLNRGKKNPYL